MKKRWSKPRPGPRWIDPQQPTIEELVRYARRSLVTRLASEGICMERMVELLNQLFPRENGPWEARHVENYLARNEQLTVSYENSPENPIAFRR